MKRILSVLIAIVMLVSCVSTVMADINITVKLDGKQIEFDVPPRAINNRTMVPLRAIFESFGATVDWNNDTRTVTSQKGETTIKLTLNDDKMYVNSSVVTLDSPACAIDGRTLVPVRAISDAFGIGVEWVAETQTVELTSPQTDALTEALSVFGSSQTVHVSGSLATADWAGGRVGTLIIREKNGGAIRYQTQFTADEKGKYEVGFPFDGSVKSCEVVVMEGSNNATTGVKSAYADTPSMQSAFIRDKDNSGSIEGAELSGVLSGVADMQGDGGEYKIIVAFYAKGGSYISFETIAQGKPGIAKAPSDIRALKMPQDTSIIKAFLCSSLRTNISVYSASTVSKDTTADKLFGRAGTTVTVAFIGDSITYQHQYLKGIEHYYHTRYPDRDIIFVNKGIGGNQAKDIISRFNWDIAADEVVGNIDEAVLLVGMNDLVVVPMTGSLKSTYMGDKGVQGKKREEFLLDVKNIVDRCKGAGISLTIAATSMYDDTVGFARATSKPYAVGVNAVLGEGVEALKNFAAKNSIPFIDLWTPTTELTDYVRETFSEVKPVVISMDRVHPDEQGGLYMAYQFIKQQGGSPIVAKVVVDAGARTINAENASVNLSTASTSKVEYSYLPKAIPFAYTAHYKNYEAWGVPITNDINQEIIKVTGLGDGNYTIKIGDNTLSCTYTAAELAKGVNIATDENNPAQIQSQEAFELVKTMLKNEQSYRAIARTEQALSSKGYEASFFGTNPTKADLAVLGSSDSFVHYFSQDPDNYGSKKYQAENWAKLRQQEQAARDASKPRRRTVVIEKQ